jgi:cytochrome c peroxidase
MQRWIVFITMPLLASFARGSERDLPAVNRAGARREPVAAVFWSDNRALIACAKSGTLIAWDLPQQRIHQEFSVGKQLRGLVKTSDNELLVIDDKANELISLRYENGRLTELSRQSVPMQPVSLCKLRIDETDYVVVSSLWARKLTVWKRALAKTDTSPDWKLDRDLPLPFEPRFVIGVGANAVSNDDRSPARAVGPVELRLVAVSEAFGNRLLWLDPLAGKVLRQREVTPRGKNPEVGLSIGGLAAGLEAGRLWFTQQTLQPELPVTETFLHRNMLLTTAVSGFGPELHPHKSGMRLSRRYDGAADPAGLLMIPKATLVCLAGSNAVAVVEHRSGNVHQLPVGLRPRTIVANERQAIVLGELDDSVTVLDLGRIEATADLVGKTAVRKYPLDPAAAIPDPSPAERGERLFFDARKSASGMLSCHSCHTDGHTNGLLADTLGDNTHGTPKRVLTLRGTRLTDLWAWNGEMKTLQDNVHKSLQDTMHATKIDPADVDDLVSFLHTLPPVPPLKPVPADQADSELVECGKKIFHREACDQCHVPPLTYTSHASYDVGLADEKGLKKFNPPSLRGVGRLRKLLHDNRANSLRDVFETHGHQLKEPLPEEELRALVRYLESL